MEQNLAIGICVVLGLLLLLKEIIRPDKGRLIWRMLASLLAAAAFYLLLFPVKYQGKKLTQANEMVLLSAGADLDSISSGINAYTIDESLYKQHKQLNYIPDLPSFLSSHPAYSKIKLFGYGLESDVLKQLKGHAIEFHPTAVAGFLNIHWNRKLKSTAEFRVSGSYSHRGNMPLTLFLSGLGAKQDSVVLSPHSITKFSLKAHPQLLGKAVYHLQVLQRKDTIHTEVLPFIVEEAAAMRTLMLSSFPDFEFKFLKNWLYENKYPLAFRSQISKDKFSTDYLNMEGKGIARVNSTLLADMDVLILDEDTYGGLGLAEKSAVDQAVQSGLGMLLLGKVKQAVRLKGEGKVLVSAVQESYRLALEGKSAAYAKLWSDQISEVARRKADAVTWAVAPQFPVPGYQTNIIIDAPQKAGIPEIRVNAQDYPVLQNMEMLFQWQSTLWPKSAGWNTLEINEQKEFFYVFKPKDWESIRNNKRIQYTKEEVSQLAKPEPVGKSDTYAIKTISVWWIFLVFLASAGYLWYEQRFLCNKIN